MSKNIPPEIHLVVDSGGWRGSPHVSGPNGEVTHHAINEGPGTVYRYVLAGTVDTPAIEAAKAKQKPKWAYGCDERTLNRKGFISFQGKKLIPYQPYSVTDDWPVPLGSKVWIGWDSFDWGYRPTRYWIALENGYAFYLTPRTK
jgi:hypothetical protein